MSETKKRIFTLELTNKEAAAFSKMCFRDGTTPAEVLEGFICDLTYAERTHGSDERMYAEMYYSRCCYGEFFEEDPNFAQWLLSEYGESTLKGIFYRMDDSKTFEEEIAYLKDNPEECKEGELEDLEGALRDSMEGIEFYFKEYTESTKKPNTLEEGLKSVSEYIEMVKQLEEEGEA